jgi:hypothetical protein
VPAATIVTVDPLVPLVVQTLGVSDEKITGLLEPPPVALTVNGALPSARLTRGSNVIDCTVLHWVAPSAEVVPGAQAVGLVAPTLGTKKPAGDGMHADWPVPGW